MVKIINKLPLFFILNVFVCIYARLEELLCLQDMVESRLMFNSHDSKATDYEGWRAEVMYLVTVEFKSDKKYVKIYLEDCATRYVLGVDKKWREISPLISPGKFCKDLQPELAPIDSESEPRGSSAYIEIDPKDTSNYFAINPDDHSTFHEIRPNEASGSKVVKPDVASSSSEIQPCED